jgi:O-antigen/teichoic acid export membrane protein
MKRRASGVGAAPIRRRLAVGVIAMTYGKLVAAIIQLAMVPALATSWGLSLYGQWLLLSTVPIFLAASDFGFGTAAGTRIIGEVSRGDEDEASLTFQSGWAMILVCSSAIGVAVLAACLFAPDALYRTPGGLVPGAARHVLAVLCVYGIISLQGSMFMAVARSAGQFALSTSLDATVQLGESMAVLVVALSGHGPMAAAITYLLARCIGVTAHIVLARWVAPWLRLGVVGARYARIRDLSRPALAAMLLPLAQAGFLQGTALAVGVAAGPRAVPLYTSLRTLSRTGLQLLMIVNLAVMPEFTSAHAQHLTARVGRIVAATSAMSVVLGVPFALVIGLFGRWIVHKWTHGVIDPPQLMVMLTAIAIVAGALWNPLSNLLLAINRHESYTYIYVAMAAITIALTFGMVHSVGVSGAAVANLLLDLVMVMAVAMSIRRNLEVGAFGWGGLIRYFMPRRDLS